MVDRIRELDELPLSLNQNIFCNTISATHQYGPLHRPPQSYITPVRRWSDSTLWSEGPHRKGPLNRRDTRVRPHMQLVRIQDNPSEKVDPLTTITETLGALNTVGSYIVNMTRGVDTSDTPKELPSAIYTISKNILGRNVTDSIAPLVRGVGLPLKPSTSMVPVVLSSPGDLTVAPSDTIEKIIDREKIETGTPNSASCTTAAGGQGKCQDLSNCPQLLLDLTKLRQSICFKSLFVPGVCCPADKNGGNVPTAVPR